MPFWITAENAVSVLNISERKLAPQSTTIAPLSTTIAPALAPVRKPTPWPHANFSEEDEELSATAEASWVGAAGGVTPFDAATTTSDATAEPKPAASEDRSCAIERGTFAFERSSDAVRLRLEREHEERNAARLRKLKVESRVAGYQAKWANSSTHSGRAFDSLPLVSDTTELDNVLKKNRAAFRSGVASAGRF